MFKIVDLTSRLPAGQIAYWERNWQGEDCYEMGWGVFPEFQGRGIASTALQLTLDRIAQRGGRRSVHAFPNVENAASNALCRKLGFELRGEVDFEYPPGQRMRCNDWAISL